MSAALLGKNFMDLNKSTVMLAIEEYLNKRLGTGINQRVTQLYETAYGAIPFYRVTLEAPTK